MAMQETVCGDCGAINRMSAAACWRCLETLTTDATAASEQERRPPVQPRPASHRRSATA
jgi:hypothetical protein